MDPARTHRLTTPDFERNPDVLKHYDLLSELGVFQEINRLKSQLIERNELLGEASALFSQTEIPDIARTAAGFLVNKFIPRRLSFLYTLEGGAEVRELAFKNLQEEPADTHLIDLEPFEEYFSVNLGLAHYRDLKEQMDNPVALEDLAPMDPELVIPVKGYAKLYGLVVISQKVVGGEYTQEELAYVDRLMSFAAIAIQNSIHYSGSVTDQKTKLFNNEFIQTEIEEEISRVRRYGGEFSILVIDLDFFKILNDRYGHLAGDLVLKEVALIIASSIREGDVAARFGGEEFVVLLHKAGSSEAFSIAERLRRAIEVKEFHHMEEMIKVTASIGCATFSQLRQMSKEELFQLADSALYRSKRSGRNMTTVSGSGLLFRASRLK